MPPPDPRKGEARESVLGLPRREFHSGGIHYAAPWGKAGTLCGAYGHVKQQPRVKAGVNCAACRELVEWIWGHRRPRAHKLTQPRLPGA